MATYYVTVIVNGKGFFMESLPEKTLLENTPSVISIEPLNPSQIILQSKVPVLSLKLRTDEPSEEYFTSVFSPNMYFCDESTTMCATLSQECQSELTFYGAIPPDGTAVDIAIQPQLQAQASLSLTPPSYPWHWKFRFEGSHVQPHMSSHMSSQIRKHIYNGMQI
eukprot:scaffold33823_cov25-Attheya_sp.AAC.1